MTEDAAPAEKQDTPTPDPGESGPENDQTPAEPEEGSTATDDTDWQERYQNLQPEYTRATQEAAQYRQIIDLARQGDEEALEILRDVGVPVAEADTKDKEGDDYRTPEDEIADLKDWKEQFEAQQRQEAEEAQLAEAEERFIDESIAALEKDEGTEFSDDYKDMLTYQALRFESEEDGLPDFEAAHRALQDWQEEQFKARVKSKRTPQVASGASASHQPDLDNPEERRAYMAQRLAEVEPTA